MNRVEFHDRLARARVTAGGVNHPVPGGMLETAENLRREYSIAREEQDEFALRSHQRAVSAQQAGRFDDEIVPVNVTDRTGDDALHRGRAPARGHHLGIAGRLRPMLGRSDGASTVTAGNASGQNDGASICLVTTRAIADLLGVRPQARLVSWAVAGVPPETMGIGPVPAVRRALERPGLALSDMDLIELNEAFAAQVLACTREWRFATTDYDRLNVNGSGISLGHPVGATGGRILATLPVS